MVCKICGNEVVLAFKRRIIHKYNISYYKCSNCGFMQTENPYWLEESYDESINLTDTGIIQRNITYSKIVASLIFFLFDKNAKYVDYAGGYGIFARLMRDFGFDFYWDDPFTINIFTRGFEYNNVDNIELVTALEVFEHFVNPIKEIGNILEISRNIIFKTVLLQNHIPNPENWWYYGFEHGQHVAFYSISTLEYIANNFNLNLYSFRDLHLLTEKNISTYIFKLIILLSKCGLFHYVNKHMSSRTFKDHEILKQNMEKN